MAYDYAALLDDTGWALLVALQENARGSFADLGRQVGLTPPAVADRIRRMEAAGIITGYHAAVNPTKLGLGLTAIIRFQATNGPLERILAELKACPEIISCQSVTGGDCMTLTTVVTSVDHLQELIAKLAIYGSSNTSIVLSSPIAHRAITRQTLAREEDLESA
jgi:Lrp/AsnC family transcriptional regulator, leucine-responsive regulatory protein